MVSKASQQNGPRRILILTADAGSGHRSASQAIEAAIQERYADSCQTSVVNPLHEARSPSILQSMAEDRYDDWVQNDPGLYELSYRMSDSIATAAIIDQVLSIMLHDALKNVIDRQNPELVVCTYPLFLEPLNFVFERSKQALPLVTVVTDLVSVHTIWFNPQASLCLVPTEHARTKARRSGLPDERIRVTGLPVHPRFGAETRPPADIRAELGWDVNVPTALIVGGTRVGRVLEIVRCIDDANLGVQLAVVAGSDENLHARLSAEKWQGRVHIYGFARNMPALIRASDVVITKAGGLIVSETLACERPMILCSAIPGQETGNVEYVISGQAGDWAPSPQEVTTCLGHWLEHGGALIAERTANARLLGRPDAAYNAADLIWEMVNAGPRPPSRELRLRHAAQLPFKAGAQVSRAVDRLEQDLRGVTDTEMSRLAIWCIGQIETEAELRRIRAAVNKRIHGLADNGSKQGG